MAKHGTVGLVMLAVVATEGALFAIVGLAGIIALFASDGNRFAYWILAVAIVGELYSLARLIQTAPTRPTEDDHDFLARAGCTPTDEAAANAPTDRTN